MATATNLELAKDKLKSSGLPVEALQALHIDVLDPAETAAIAPHFPEAPALRIRYMDPFTTNGAAQVLRHHPRFPAFERIRIIGPEVQGRDGKVLRYLQPRDIGVCAYFPSLIDWVPVLEDPDYSLVITEGELKAAKATAMGICTIGLGGVNNIYSRLTGCGLLPELKRINWVGRRVYICFDNDGAIKPNVVQGINTLGRELCELGAIIFVITLPDPPKDKKMGLDDYLLNHTRDDFEKLKDRAESLTMAQELWRMNELAVKVRSPMCVIDRHDMETIGLDVFKAHYSNLKTPEQLLNAHGEMSYKLVPLAEYWLKWPLRTSVLGITYAPGQERFTDSGTTFNLWGGWGSVPKKGDVKLFLKLLEYQFGTTKEGKAALKWFLQWVAYPIKFPGSKLYTSVLLWSPEHGTGKTLLGYTIGRVYGEKNWKEVRQRDLHGTFSSWAKNKQFIVGTEITGTDSREIADELKGLITSEKLTINEKYIPEYDLPNVAQFFLNSNRASALFLEDDDRRFFVWKVQEKAPDEFFVAYDKWYKTPDAIAAVHHYLLQVDTSDFNPFAKAMQTEAKVEMTEDMRSGHAMWCHRLKASPDFYLRVGKQALVGDLFTSAELLLLFKQGDPMSTVKANTFGIDLKAAGFVQLQQIRWGNPERQDRLFVVRNDEHWKLATPIQVRKHLEQTKGGR